MFEELLADFTARKESGQLVWPVFRWKNSNLDLKQAIEIYDFDGEFITLQEKIWALANQTKVRPKCDCGEHTSFINVQKGFLKFCSSSCAQNSERTRQKFVETCIERYGSANPNGNIEVLSRRVKTNVERYGGGAPLCCPSVMEKTKITNQKRYGATNPMKSLEIQQKVRNASFERFGTGHPLQNREFFDNHQKKLFKTKELIVDNTVFNLQGFEPQCLQKLIDLGVFQVSDFSLEIPTISYQYNGRKASYHPDFYVPKDNLIIEVKSAYTFNADYIRNLLKQQACISTGYNFWFLIWDDKEQAFYSPIIP